MADSYIDVMVRVRIPAAQCAGGIGDASMQVKNMIEASMQGRQYYSNLTTVSTVAVIKAELLEPRTPDAAL